MVIKMNTSKLLDFVGDMGSYKTLNIEYNINFV